jgi:hypothetical protein
MLTRRRVWAQRFAFRRGKPVKRLIVLLVLTVAAVTVLAVSPSALADGVIHRVSVGGADFLPPGTDANFSLSVVQRADGTVTGQWQDSTGGGGVPAVGIHVQVDCLLVVGNEAWISGVITQPDSLAGLPAITRVADNGTSANDPPDQISFTFINTGFTCEDQPNLPLFDMNNGEVTVE